MQSPQEKSPSAMIVAEITRRIENGELRPGDRVPSTRAITREWGVAMATATRALATLQDRGLVQARPGSGTVVSPAAGTPASAPRAVEGAVVRRPDSSVPADLGSGQPTLSSERIIAAATGIADTDGLAALSMRRVAADLGVATMSLYRHVRGKDELLTLMVESVFSRYALPPRGADGRAALETVCRLQWSAYQRHPWLAQWVSMSRPQLVSSAMAHTECAMAILADLGLGVHERLHMAVTLANYVRGTAVNLEPEVLAQQDTGLTSDQWMATQENLMGDIVASGDFPMFAELATDPTLDLNMDSLFEFGLARLLDGLEAMVARRQRTDDVESDERR